MDRLGSVRIYHTPCTSARKNSPELVFFLNNHHNHDWKKKYHIFNIYITDGSRKFDRKAAALQSALDSSILFSIWRKTRLLKTFVISSIQKWECYNCTWDFFPPEARCDCHLVRKTWQFCYTSLFASYVRYIHVLNSVCRAFRYLPFSFSCLGGNRFTESYSVQSIFRGNSSSRLQLRG